MRTSEFKIPTNNLPIFKQAARELGIDFINEPIEQGNEWINCHAIIYDDFQLVSLGFIAGTNGMATAFTNPMNEIIDSIERKINNIGNNDK